MQHFRVAVSVILVALSLFFAPVSRASDQAFVFEAKWPRSRVVISASNSLSNAPNIHGDAFEAIRLSIAAWAKSADLRIESITSDAQNVSLKGASGDGISLITAASTAENVRLFPKQAASPAAVTRIFVDRRGSITEADIVLNPFVKFSTDGTFGTFDLQATLTHEIGHLLGLDHSPAWGSVMFGKTALSYGPSSHVGRRDTLPDVDVAAVRALYGPRAEDVSCCGSLGGRLTGFPLTGKDRKIVVWLEDMETGRLVAASTASDDGQYELSGISEGSYRLRVAGEFGDNLVASDEAPIQILVADLVRKSFKLDPANAAFSAGLIGTTPQLARLPATIRRGSVHRLFVGAAGLESGIARIQVSGTDLIVRSDEFLGFESYGNSVKVISFDLAGSYALADGEYSILIEDRKGVRRFMVGALTIFGQ